MRHVVVTGVALPQDLPVGSRCLSVPWFGFRPGFAVVINAGESNEERHTIQHLNSEKGVILQTAVQHAHTRGERVVQDVQLHIESGNAQVTVAMYDRFAPPLTLRRDDIPLCAGLSAGRSSECCDAFFTDAIEPEPQCFFEGFYLDRANSLDGTCNLSCEREDSSISSYNLSTTLNLFTRTCCGSLNLSSRRGERVLPLTCLKSLLEHRSDEHIQNNKLLTRHGFVPSVICWLLRLWLFVHIRVNEHTTFPASLCATNPCAKRLASTRNLVAPMNCCNFNRETVCVDRADSFVGTCVLSCERARQTHRPDGTMLQGSVFFCSG